MSADLELVFRADPMETRSGWQVWFDFRRPNGRWKTVLLGTCDTRSSALATVDYWRSAFALRNIDGELHPIDGLRYCLEHDQIADDRNEGCCRTVEIRYRNDFKPCVLRPVFWQGEKQQ